MLLLWGRAKNPSRMFTPDSRMVFGGVGSVPPGVSCPDQSLLGGGLAAGRAALDGSLRPVHADSRPSSADRGDCSRGPVGQHRLFGARDHVLPGGGSDTGRPAHLPDRMTRPFSLRPDFREADYGPDLGPGSWSSGPGSWSSGSGSRSSSCPIVVSCCFRPALLLHSVGGLISVMME